MFNYSFIEKKVDDDINYSFSSSSTKNINTHLTDTRNSMVAELDKMTNISNHLCFFSYFTNFSCL